MQNSVYKNYFGFYRADRGLVKMMGLPRKPYEPILTYSEALNVSKIAIKDLGEKNSKYITISLLNIAGKYLADGCKVKFLKVGEEAFDIDAIIDGVPASEIMQAKQEKIKCEQK